MIVIPYKTVDHAKELLQFLMETKQESKQAREERVKMRHRIQNDWSSKNEIDKTKNDDEGSILNNEGATRDNARSHQVMEVMRLFVGG